MNETDSSHEQPSSDGNSSYLIPRICGQFDAEGLRGRLSQLGPWSNEEHADSRESIEILQQALKEYPGSPNLWCLLGDTLRLSGGCCDIAGSNKECYERALKSDPLYGEAYESLGFVADIEEQPVPAEALFRQAIANELSIDSHIGLAQVLAAKGETAEALSVLADARDEFSNWLLKCVSKIERCRDEIIYLAQNDV